VRRPPRPPPALTPASDLQAAHAKRPGAMGTLLATRVPAKKASEFAQVVAHEATGELLHYTERPQTCAPYARRAARL